MKQENRVKFLNDPIAIDSLRKQAKEMAVTPFDVLWQKYNHLYVVRKSAVLFAPEDTDVGLKAVFRLMKRNGSIIGQHFCVPLPEITAEPLPDREKGTITFACQNRRKPGHDGCTSVFRMQSAKMQTPEREKVVSFRTKDFA